MPTWWWWFPEMTASFLLFAIIIGLIARMGEGVLTTSFVDGSRDLLGVALIIGIARGITVIMNNGQITDTVLHWVERALGDTGEAAFAIVMFALFLPLSFLIPSSSGLATLAMPITAPLAGFVDVQVARRDRVPERLGPDEPVHPDVGRRHGRPRHRPRSLRDHLRWVWPLLALLTGLVVIVLAVAAVLCLVRGKDSGERLGHASSCRSADAEDVLADLERLVAIPSVAFPGYPPEPVNEMASETLRLFRDAGCTGAALMEVPNGYPPVYGEIRGPAETPIVTLYAHYDVQPAPLEQGWTSDPWTAIRKDGRIYGRGAADDKSGLAVTSERSRRSTASRLARSESSSRGWRRPTATSTSSLSRPTGAVRLRRLRRLRHGNLRVGEPTVTTALRGDVACIVTVRTLEHPLHSGEFGGPARTRWSPSLGCLRAFTTMRATWPSMACLAWRGTERTSRPRTSVRAPPSSMESS